MAEEENEGLTDAAKSEIAAAIAILKSDGIHIHKTYASFMKGQEEAKKDGSGSENPNPGNEDPGNGEEGQPPPKKEEDADPPKKKGLWWGDRED
jgi:hypothetical protein